VIELIAVIVVIVALSIGGLLLGPLLGRGCARLGCASIADRSGDCSSCTRRRPPHS
jgi:hypothetical protein